ncbi:MAG: ABC transporter permease [Myxococcaceae bacterium]
MKASWLIARRELAAYLRSMSGYVIIAVTLAIDALLFNTFAIGGMRKSSEVLGRFFYVCSGPTMVASIFLAMRLLAEERQAGTLPLLYSSPVKDSEIVFGKWLSAFLYLALMTVLTLFMPLLILVNGKVSWGHVLAGYVGLLLLGSASLAIGTLGSAIARTQVVAAIVSAVILVSMLVCWILAPVTEKPFSDVFTALALHGIHFTPFQTGIIHLRDVAYYVLITVIALFASTRIVESRRWR